MASVTLEGIGKRFGAVRALEPVDLEVADGEFLALLGPSGCGKTTTLNIVAGLEAPSEGRLLIGGEDMTRVPAPARDLAMVFQSYALYPHMTVEGNLGFALEVRRLPREEIARRVRRAAEALDLVPLLGRYPKALSGGQRQRVALGRALVREPRAFLLDEPLSNLDAVLRLQMRGEIATLFRGLGATALYVTHDQAEAMTMADRIAVFRAGRLQQVGAPLAIYRAPANAFVAGFVGAPPMSFAAATLAEDAVVLEGGARLPRPSGLAVRAGARVTLGLRPEDLRLDEGGLVLPVERVEHLGGAQIAHLRAGGARLTLLAPPDAALAPGRSARVAVAARDLYLFDPETGGTLAAPGLGPLGPALRGHPCPSPTVSAS
ncbi:ABC transporter ATP-binding protein [Rubellimicrobium sp. CFH 75288]|uniref:ABC transporter ATP-binding protein n=1 Tax=Rubellimicrobium sp. CFH 75288 TaxID=2697034 RepID=UPI001412D01B|nr:ABC transporter ATP-binding protein [Rubellimicrobium sp. CFH 75288]NAZ36583.1 ATP-binding cassette domain-containing protein [Rubellimicrobium sp. CFH 75288]